MRGVNMCIERQLAGERLLRSARIARNINPVENAPPFGIDEIEPELTITREDVIFAGALVTKKKWAQHSTITVSFLNGTLEEQKFIRDCAQEWIDLVNLKVEWVSPYAPAMIRIVYRQGAGSWSWMAADALAIPQNEPTMQISWLDAPLIWHEWAHGLIGMIHEHQHPLRAYEYDPEPTYKLWGGPPNNWSREQIDREIISKYPREQTNFGEYDPDSIAHYTVDNAVTVGDFEVGYNSVISEGDKAFARREYPPHAEPPPSTVPLWSDIGYFDDLGNWKPGTGSRKINRAYLQPMPDGTVRAVPWSETLYG